MPNTVLADPGHPIGVAAERPRRVPLSTYRLQLNTTFTFADARAILPYLDQLGISDCYTSPYFAAQPGSTHGYDVGDYNALNPELGGEAEFDHFVAALGERGMSHLLDFVPNHMGTDPRSNPWWHDVLENGPCSPSARFFDIDWAPVKDELAGKLLLPILGDQYGKVLERGELRLSFADGQLVLDYFDHRLPINPRQAPRAYRHGLDALQAELGEEDSQLLEFLSILTALESMPVYTASDPASIAVRRREKEIGRRRLAVLVEACPRIREHVEGAVRVFNGEPGRPESFDRLHDLLEAQAYRLAYWRTALHEINYRRFFDINSLAGVRVEDPEAFEATHRLLFRLMREEKVQSIRVDHPDGLLDPARYFDDLQALAARAWGEGAGATSRPAYVIVEKILSAVESLPESWAVHGTVGYDFLNHLNGLFVQPTNARRLRRLHGRLTGRDEPFEDVAYDSKQIIMETALASELNVLARELNRISEDDRRSRDFTLNSLRDALLEVVACFPVYRTYVTDAGWTARDREVVDVAVARARGRNPALEPSVFDFVRDVLLPGGASRDEGHAPPYDPDTAHRLRFSMKFQQYTAPVQAKGIEDTAFYRHNVLLSLNEVGGDPRRFGCDPQTFHAANAARAAHRPLEMVTTATHDTKLGEDVRARLNVLSELAEEWSREVTRWMHLTRGACRVVDGSPAPDRNDRFRFFQALLGIWPPEIPAAVAPPAAPPEPVGRLREYLTRAVRFFRARSGITAPKTPALAGPPDLVHRLREYMIKAIREAKLHTSWISPNESYEAATTAFVENLLVGPLAARFLPAFLPFQRRVAQLGMVNSLAQTVLKLTAPGVPDFYQGTELWDLTLVDPDNRRPVDFARRQALLEQLEPLLPPLDNGAWRGPRTQEVSRLLDAWPDGRVKIFVTACGLRMRRGLPELFLAGDYEPLEADVRVPAGVVAFARTRGPHALVTLVPRLFASLVHGNRPLPLGGECWNISHVVLPNRLATRKFRNVLTGEFVEPVHTHGEAWLFVGQVLQTCPVAILEAVD